MSRRIALFNHKGGTGKTVSAYNIGWKLTSLGHRVLLVDGDSQVNLTALALGFEKFDDYYEDASTKNKNIKDAVSPVFEGKPAALTAFDCPTALNNENLFVLPGHADLAAYEGQISLAQETAGSLSVMKNLPGALQTLISMTEQAHNIDYTLIDLNPGLGAINQNFFMACDAFIVPTNPDPFSLMAIGTLGVHLVRWIEWKKANFNKFLDSDYPLHERVPVFLGTLNSRFNKHASKAARKFDQRINQIDQRVNDTLVPALSKAGMTVKNECYQSAFDAWKDKLTPDNKGKFALARIPDFQALVHTANLASVPIYNLTEESLKRDEIVGVVKEKALKNVESFDLIYNAIAAKNNFDRHMSKNAEAFKIYSFLDKNGYKAEFGLRYIWVASVSAIDHYISEFIIEKNTEHFVNGEQLCNKTLNENIPLSSILKLQNVSPTQAAVEFRKIISAVVRYRTFQKADDIADGLAFVWSEDHKWDKISRLINMKNKDAKRKLNSICYRRDLIVHNADYNNATASLTDCNPSDALECHRYINLLADTIDSLIP